jgi:hypothetical protein
MRKLREIEVHGKRKAETRRGSPVPERLRNVGLMEWRGTVVHFKMAAWSEFYTGRCPSASDIKK